MKSLPILTFLGLFLISTSLFAQGWEQAYGGLQLDRGYHVTRTSDGNYLIDGFSADGFGQNIFGSFVMKVNDRGEQIWVRMLPETVVISNLVAVEDSQGDYLMHTNELIGNRRSPKFIKVAPNGNTIWEITPFDTASVSINVVRIFPKSTGGYDVFTRRDNGNGDVLQMMELGMDGVANSTRLLDTQIAAQSSRDFIRNPSGGYTYIEQLSGDSLYLYQIDAAGTFLGVDAYPMNLNPASTPDRTVFVGYRPNGELMVVTSESGSTIYRQLRFDAQQNLVADEEIYNGQVLLVNHAQVIEDGLVIVGYTNISVPDPTGVFLMQTDLSGAVVWEREHANRPGAEEGAWVTSAHGGGFVVIGNATAEINTAPDVYLFKTDNEGYIYTNLISGTVSIDDNANCNFDMGEQGLDDWIITAEKPGKHFVSSTDENGDYLLPVDTGNYIVRIAPPSNYWAPCVNDVSANFATFDNRQTIDFSLTSLYDCPQMTVSGIIPTIRPCFERPAYINYCNYGTILAEDAYLEIVLDSSITMVSSTLPWSNVSGNTYTFDLGDVEPLECGSFRMNLLLDCDSPLGLSYCMETYIYPDSLCAPPPAQWSGAFLEVDGTCEGENPVFSIQNTGQSTMPEHSHYIIVEDAILLKRDSIQLTPGGQHGIPIDGNGSTFTLIADQVPNAPGGNFPVAVVEACGENTNGEFSINFSNQFPQNDADPSVDIDCPISIGSYDPNDKLAYPIGYREEHFIRPNTPLDYRIRFQNTGTDTAFTVVIRDTLDAWLDASTIQLGASSHDYEFDISGEGYMNFTFNNIDLPDSNVNLIASEGFVAFKILPFEETPLQTVIENQAAIYFDFNPPIITNETFHTIAEDYLEVLILSTQHPTLSGIEVKVHPNPFRGVATLSIEGHDAKQYQFEVYDAAGRRVRSAQPDSNRFDISGAGLPAGLYFYRLTADDGFLSTGKLVVK
ncbi:MAG: T9SS type A sorting domain-containing protein [Bacteroidota bacterium]